MSDKSGGFNEIIKRSIYIAKSRIEHEGEYVQISEEAYKRAQNILRYAFKVPDSWADTRQLLLTMIPKMEMAGYRNGWIQYLEEGLKISRAQEDTFSLSELSVAIGYLELVQANFQSAEKWFTHAQQGFSKIGDDRGHGKVLNRLARLRLDQEEYKASVAFAQSALSLLRNADVERANSHYVIGSVYRIEGKLAEAESHYRTSLRIWEDANDQRRIAWGLGNLGIVFLLQEEYNAAVSHFTQALEQFEHVHDPANEAQIMNSLAAAYLHMKSLDETDQLLIQAQKIFIRLKDDLGVARTSHNLGLYYFEKGRWAFASESYEQCLILWAKLGLTSSLCNTLDSLGKVYLAQNNFIQAMKTLQHGMETLASISDHPRYARLKESLTIHLRKAKEGMGEQSN